MNLPRILSPVVHLLLLERSPVCLAFMRIASEFTLTEQRNTSLGGPEFGVFGPDQSLIARSHLPNQSLTEVD